MSHKLGLFFVCLILLGFGLALTISNVQAAAVPVAVEGWAWSSNVGWVKFPQTTDSDYAKGHVVINDSDADSVISGQLSGHAWSSNIGWVDFNGVNLTAAGILEGVAKVVSGGTAQSGGWDGWIRMSPTSGSGWGIRKNGNKLEGYAWGNNVVGWLNFSSNLPGVGAKPKITIDDVTVPEGDSGNSNATFTVTLSNVVSQTVTVNYTTNDVSATAGSDYTTANGALTFAAGQVSKTINVSVFGDIIDEEDETFTVRLSNLSANAEFGNDLGEGMIVDDDDAGGGGRPRISITATDPDAAEPVGSEIDTGTFTVTRTGSTVASLTVYFAVSGNATNGVDYDTIGNSVTIAAGQSAANLTVKPKSDTLVEGNETVSLILSSNALYRVVQPSVATVTIKEAALSASVVTIRATDPNASEVGPDGGTFTITRTGSTLYNRYIYFTKSGTASTADYQPTITSQVLMLAGLSSVNIYVTPVTDTTQEGNETLTLTLTNGTGYTVGVPGNATVTISDTALQHPTLPRVSIDDVRITEGDSGNINATFTASLSVATDQDVTMRAATQPVSATGGGSCDGGIDYLSRTFSALTINANTTSKTISIPVCGDSVDESDETFTVQLSNLSANAEFGDDLGEGTIVDDDGPGEDVCDPNTEDCGGGGGGGCDPNKEVCVGGGGGGTPLAAICGGVVSDSVPNSGNRDRVTWTATPSGGTLPYFYAWTDNDSLDSPNWSAIGISAGKTYNVSSGQRQVEATVVVTDSASSANVVSATCPAVTIGPSVGEGHLEITDGHGVVEIRSQAPGQPAFTVVKNSSGVSGVLAAKINAVGGDVNGVTIKSADSKKSNGSSLFDVALPDVTKCQLLVKNSSDTYTSGDNTEGSFQPCNNFAPFNLSLGKSAFFRIRVARPLKAIADNNPYQIIIGNNSGISEQTVAIQFNYLVGTFQPR